MAVKVQLHSEAIERAIAQYGHRAARGVARAMNRSVGSGRTIMARHLSQDLGLPVASVRSRINVREASATRLTAQLTASPKRIPLVDFRARGPQPSRGRGRGVTARLPGGAGRYPHAFIATMPSGHRGVFQRVPRGGKLMRGRARRQAIYELFGPSIVQAFEKHVDIARARVTEQLQKNMESELKFALRDSSAAP
jgi:hypothetical protein